MELNYAPNEKIAQGRTAGKDEIADHSGKSIRMDRDFFAQPPPEIGQILSADSTLKLGKTGLPIALVWLLRFGLILAILVFVIYRQHVLFGSTSANPIPFIATFFAGIMLIVGIPIWMIFKFTAYTHQCTYVGKNGISMSTLKG